jgi:hypothetical protein
MIQKALAFVDPESVEYSARIEVLVRAESGEDNDENEEVDEEEDEDEEETDEDDGDSGYSE